MKVSAFRSHHVRPAEYSEAAAKHLTCNLNRSVSASTSGRTFAKSLFNEALTWDAISGMAYLAYMARITYG